MKRLLFAALMTVCSVSWAEWELIEINEEFVFYFDKKTIQKNGTAVKMWEMKDYVSVQYFQGEQYNSEKIYKVYDCNSKMQTIASLIYFSNELGGGNSIWSDTRQEKDWEWVATVPSSIGHSLWQIACGKK